MSEILQWLHGYKKYYTTELTECKFEPGRSLYDKIQLLKTRRTQKYTFGKPISKLINFLFV